MVFEALHYGALAPALGSTLGRRDLPRGAVLLAAAFAMSWVGDSLAVMTGGAWYTSHLWLPVQFGLVLWAVTDADVERVTPVGMIAIAMLLSIGLYAPGPDVFVTLAGSIIVVALAASHRPQLLLPVALYFGVGSVCYLMMVGHYFAGSDPSLANGGFRSWWRAYQVVRVLAWAAFLLVLWRHQHPRHPRFPEVGAPIGQVQHG